MLQGSSRDTEKSCLSLFTSSMATNTSLNRLLSKLLKKKFEGVFPIHYAIKKINKMKPNNSLIINSACISKSEDGHFFSVIKLNKKKLLIFDSLCKENAILTLIKPVLPKFTEVKINKLQIQSNQSSYCGLFSTAFILTYYKKNSFSDFFKMLDYNHLENNDRIISDYLTELVKDIVRK